MAVPSPTLASTVVSYIPAGVRRYVFVPTIANPSSPTSAEITAGTDYTNAINAVSGFTTSADTTDTSTYGSDYMTTSKGMRSSDDSSWTLLASKTGTTDARTALALGTTGYVCIFDEGIVTGGHLDVWPVMVRSCNPDQVAKGDPATITVQYAVPQPPVQNLTVPTS